MTIIFRKGFRFHIIVLFFLLSSLSYGQLSNFTFQVAVTHETCLGNGTLTFTVGGTVSGSSMDYEIYLLPNISSPLATVTTNSISGLNAGNYRVVATQSLNGNSGTQQQDVVINDLIQPLTYSLTGTNVKCGNDGKITVNITSGNPANYQIISGPVIVPAQGSNIFSNLPIGVYQIKVFDNCGEAVVQTFTLWQSSISLVIDPVTFPQTVLSTCNTIRVSNFFGALTGSQIAFPLTVEYSIFPPGGGPPIVITQTMTSGDTVEQIIPFYNNQSYNYNLKVTDACGTVYNKNNVVNKKFDALISELRLNCTDIALKVMPNYFVAPYTISFLSFPPGFNPAAFNAGHPGPFSSSFEIYGGVGNSFPLGAYSIQLTDACGRTIVKNFNATPINITPTITASNDGCGHIEIGILTTELVSVIMTAAPATYSFPLPHNLSNLINGSQFNIYGLPDGTYTFQVTDSCNMVHTLQVTILPYQPAPLFIVNRPGCEDGYGSLRLNSPEGIVSVSLINAPATYTGTIPADLTAAIESGTFYFNNVPEGNYTFLLVNDCGGQRTDTVTVTGYHITTNNVTLTENCGSFNLFLQHISNGSFQQTFWLQKFDPLTNSWGHPATGVTYTDGTVPTNQNSIQLYNNINNLNLAYNGQFRIVKNFLMYPSQGSFVNCAREIKTFEILQGPKIINVYSFGCTNGTNEVIVEAVGIPPLSYSITTKNGLPFVVNNGTQNLFSNLTPGIYNFQVQDVCGNIVNSLYDITTASPLSIQASVFCDMQNGSLSVTPFSFLSYEWWKGNNTATILSTTSTLQFTPFNQTNDFGIYHVRISNPNNTGSCINLVLDYAISSSLNNPNAGDGSAVDYCGPHGNVDLFTLLSGAYDTGGIWQEITNSGTLNNNMWNSDLALPGTYQFRYRVNGLCTIVDDALVTINFKAVPETPLAGVDGIACDGHDLNLTATLIPDAIYSWTGPSGFTSDVQNPIIANGSAQNNGTYSVKVIVNGCESEVSSVEVNVNASPQFGLEGFCDQNAFMIIAAPISNTFNVDEVEYRWTGPDGAVSTGNPINASGAPGTYQLEVTNAAGCTVTKSIVITNTACTVPLGISPNGDGQNDEFDLSGFDVIKLEIFSRYGRLVYEQDNYTKQWHGQDFNNRELPPATYYYYMQLESGEQKTGWVYVMR